MVAALGGSGTRWAARPSGNGRTLCSWLGVRDAAVAGNRSGVEQVRVVGDGQRPGGERAVATGDPERLAVAGERDGADIGALAGQGAHDLAIGEHFVTARGLAG